MAAIMLTSKTADSQTRSVSSCLKASKENFLPKLPQTDQNLSDYYKLFLGSKEDDGEIAVFQAEKYFNGVMDHPQQDRPTVLKAQMSGKQAKNKNALRLGVAVLNSEFTRKEDFETESNASSDLFEIESLTGKVRSPQTSGTASDFCPAVPTAVGYAPSEVSIQWSVITESAADLSVVSDFDGGGGRWRGAKVGCAAVVKSDGGGERRLGVGALLGCKSQKAVRVAGDALRSVSWKYGQVGEERRSGSSSLAIRNPVARFQAVTRLTRFDGKRGSHLLEFD